MGRAVGGVMARTLRLVRAMVFGVLLLFVTLGCGVVVLVRSFAGPIRHSDQLDFGDKVMGFWSRFVMGFLGVRLKVLGGHHVPPGGCVFVFNHKSWFDATVGVLSFIELKKKVRFGGKAVLFKLPVFGRCIKFFGLLPIHRGDRQRVLQLYKKSVQRVKNGESFALALEGGRTDAKAPTVGSVVKKGPFIFAREARAPVVPLLIVGSARVHAKGDFWPALRHWVTNITVHVLPSFPTKNLKEDEFLALPEKLRSAMAAKSMQL